MGNLVTETSTTGQGHVESNTFSAINRLTTQDVTDNGIPTNQFGYTYDYGGNILTTTAGGLSTTFTYGSANRLLTVNGQNVTHDADQNITNAPLGGTPLSFTYNSRNLMTAAGTSSYSYDGENHRTSKTVGGQTTTYDLDLRGPLDQTLIKTVGGVSTYYVYGLGLIAEQTGTTYKTYHFDLRGSTIALTNSSGLVTDTYSYGPYGELLDHVGTSQVDYQYNGRDGVITDENGLYYMRARYYSPELKRFMNEDNFAGKYDDIQNINLFAYCEGDPIGSVDPSGEDNFAAMGTNDWDAWDGKAPDIITMAYNDMVGEDLNTLQDPNASKLRKALALATFIPGGKIAKFAGKATLKAGKYFIKGGRQAFEAALKGSKALKSGSKASFKLTNGMSMKTDDALDAASEYLGKGYKDMGGGRYVSADGTKQVRFTDSDLVKVKNHAGAPHMNFEVLIPNPSKPGKMIPDPKRNIHVFLED